MTLAERAVRENAYRRDLRHLYLWILAGNSIVAALLSIALILADVRWVLALAGGVTYVVLTTGVLILPRGPSADLRAYFLQRRTPPI